MFSSYCLERNLAQSISVPNFNYLEIFLWISVELSLSYTPIAILFVPFHHSKPWQEFFVYLFLHLFHLRWIIFYIKHIYKRSMGTPCKISRLSNSSFPALSSRQSPSRWIHRGALVCIGFRNKQICSVVQLFWISFLIGFTVTWKLLFVVHEKINGKAEWDTCKRSSNSMKHSFSWRKLQHFKTS